MSCSQKQAVITLLQKSGKDCALLEKWWPIYLVNVDTKISSKVIAARLKKVLPSIILYNQTGYVKDRFIGEAIRSILGHSKLLGEETSRNHLLIFSISCISQLRKTSQVYCCLQFLKKLLIVWNGNFSLRVLKSLTLVEASFNG